MKKSKNSEDAVFNLFTTKKQIDISHLYDKEIFWHSYSGEFKELKAIQHYLLDGNSIAMMEDSVLFRQVGYDSVTSISREISVIPNHFSEEVSGVLNIFNKISKPYSVINFKLKAICAYLEEIGITPEIQRVPGYKSNIIVPSKGIRKKVVMSHYDLIPTFDNAFWVNNCLSFVEDEIIGALDNSITNAVLLWMLKEKLIPDDVEIVFSSEEERGGNGAKAYMESLGSSRYNLSFINLDVTNEFKDDDDIGMSIEYDAYNVKNIPLLWDFCSDGKTGVTFDRVGDDMCTILHCGGRGASFCLPTKKTIHSFKNKTTVHKLKIYMDKLLLVLNGVVDFSLPRTGDLNIKSFKSTKNLSVEEILEKFRKTQISSSRTASLFEEDFVLNKRFQGIDDDEDNVVFVNGGNTLDSSILDEVEGFIDVHAPISNFEYTIFHDGVFDYLYGKISKEKMEELRLKLSPYKTEFYKKQFWNFLNDAFEIYNQKRDSENKKFDSAKELADYYAKSNDDKRFLKRLIEGWLIELNTEHMVLQGLLKINSNISPSEIESFVSDMHKLAVKNR